MDPYKVLGLSKTASKAEIKEAFHKLAVQFHPDKHSLSPQSVKDHATCRFRQVSEAYEVLIDDRKRADYNLRGNYSNSNSNYRNNNGSYSRSNGYYSNYGYGFSYSSNGFSYSYKLMTTRSFLINLVFAGVLLGGSIFIDTSGDALWKMRNSGKSFEEAMESMEKSKAADKDDKT